jgi:hypothetical protein
MMVDLPPLEGAGPSAVARRKAVRSALLASEAARHRAIRVVSQAKRGAPAGGPEYRAWSALLERLMAASPWPT